MEPAEQTQCKTLLGNALSNTLTKNVKFTVTNCEKSANSRLEFELCSYASRRNPYLPGLANPHCQT